MNKNLRLSQSQLDRIENIAELLKEVYPISKDEWVEGFALDSRPEQEIKIWEIMSLSYSEYISDKDLSLEAKNEVFNLASNKIFGKTDEQILNQETKFLTSSDRAEFLIHFYAACKKLDISW